jgi:hypothetical protein
MRIARFDLGDGCVYRVYADDDADMHGTALIGQMIRQLRGEGWPFLLGGTLADPGAILIIGPLEREQEAAFEWRWRGYIG